MNILFICTGNTCRSPMAEALLKEKLPVMNVQSAGIFANENETANNQAVLALEEMDISFTHASQSVTLHTMHWADVVLTMTENHKLMLQQLFPQCEDKVFTLIEYVLPQISNRITSGNDIPDPFGGSMKLYRQTATTLDYYIAFLVEKLKQHKE